MSISSEQSNIQRSTQALANLQSKKAEKARKVSDESKRASEARMAASRATSPSSLQSKLRDAERHEGYAQSAQRDVADIERQIGSEQQRLHDAQNRLRKDEQYEADKRQRDQKRDDDQRRRDQDKAEREHKKRMQDIDQSFSKVGRNLATVDSTLRRHDYEHASTRATLERLANPPQTITVLMLAADPIPDPNASTNPTRLRLDEEARDIEQRIRASKHRDSVKFVTKWAVRPLDLLQAINEHRPTVVHFTGHGTPTDQIVFQDDQGGARYVPKSAIAATLATASDSVRLVFFNTCFSKGQAEEVVGYIPAAIGMNDAVGDTAARVFSASFYSAIGFGSSVANAFQQAKAALLLEGIGEDDIPELHTAIGVDATTLTLVSNDE